MSVKASRRILHCAENRTCNASPKHASFASFPFTPPVRSPHARPSSTCFCNVARRERTHKTRESLFGSVAAGTMALALLLPFFLWGNPYPLQVIPYWALGTLAAV